MGLFDIVDLSEDIKKILGKYSEGEFQTKYLAENGYLYALNLIVRRHITWKTDIFIKLLIKPRSPDVFHREPFMEHVKLEELGVLKHILVEARVNLDVENLSLLENFLKENGFSYNGVSRGEFLDRVVQDVSKIYFGEEQVATISIVKPSIFRGMMIIRTDRGRVTVDLDAHTCIDYGGGYLRIYKEDLEWISYEVENYSKKIHVEKYNMDFMLNVSIHNRGLADIYAVIEAKALLDPVEGLEERIDYIADCLEDFIKNIILYNLYSESPS